MDWCDFWDTASHEDWGQNLACNMLQLPARFDIKVISVRLNVGEVSSCDTVG